MADGITSVRVRGEVKRGLGWKVDTDIVCEGLRPLRAAKSLPAVPAVGRYEGLDQSGQPCSLSLLEVKPAGDDELVTAETSFSGRTFTLMYPLLGDGVDRSLLTGNFGDEYQAETLNVKLEGAAPVYAEYYNNSGAHAGQPVYKVCKELKPAK
jgi:hypothetical protein